MIVVDALHAGYRLPPLHHPVLRDVSFRAVARQVTAVVGPNGTGKTTLFRVLLGFLRPRRGRVLLAGEPPERYRRRRGIAFLPESPTAPRGWSPRTLLEEGADLRGLGGQERKDAILEGLRRTGLDPAHHDRRLARLSKGMIRRTLLAYALLGDPGVVLLDEPMAGLDPEARSRLRDVVRETASRGATLVLASHELDEVARLADRAVVLRDGRVAGTVEEVSDGDALMRALSATGDGS